VQALLRNVTFRVNSDVPTTTARTLTFSVTDSAGAMAATDTDTKTVNVTATNDNPNLDLSTENVNYQIGGSPVVISATGTVSDVDSPNFDTGTLTVQITAANATTNDRLSIRNQGTASGQIGVSGSNVTFGGTTIGTFAGGVGGADPLIITFNSSATEAAVEALTRNIVYSSIATTPTIIARTANFTLTDGDGGTDTASKLITQSNPNDAPVLTLSTETVTYTENAAAIAIAATTTITDSNSANFNGGNLTVTITANGTADDRLDFLTGGGVTTSGSNVLVNGTVIGTFTGGTGTTPLVVTFNTDATVANVQTLLRNIGFRNVSDTPSTAARTVQFSVTDAGGVGGLTDTDSKSVAVTATNDAPVFTPSTETVSYQAGGSAVIVSATGTVTDVDSTDFDTGTLTVTITSAAATDILSIVNQGTGAGQIGVSGSSITFGGTTIGTFTGGTGTTPLVITFNSSATPAAVQALTQRIAYSTSTAAVSAGTKTINFALTDGDGGTDTTRTKSVTVTVANVAPVFTPSTETVTYPAGGAPQIISSSGTVVDTDSTNFDTGTLTVTVASAVSTDILSILNQGTASGQIGVSGNTITFGGTQIATFSGGTGNPLVITFNASATPTAVQALTRRIAYSTSSSSVTLGSRSVQFVLTDGDGGTDTTRTKSLTVAANAAPTVTLSTEARTYAENDAPLQIGLTSTITDTDSADFNGGTLTITITANGTVDDRLGIKNIGGITTSGSNVLSGGTIIGTFAGGTGTTPLVITLNASANVTNTQALLRAITFQTVADQPSTTARTISATLNDGDGATSAASTKSIAVTATNDPPVNTVPGTQKSLNGAEVVFNTANNNVISVNDPDLGTGVIRIQLTVTNGTLTLSGTTGLTFVTGGGDGTDDATMTFTGTLASVNAALLGMKFKPTAGTTKDAKLTIVSDDGGTTAGGAKDTDTVLIRQTQGTGNSSVVGTVFVDSNNNGKQDKGEIGIKGVTVTLAGQGDNSGVTRTTTTNGHGVFRFNDLEAGDYKVTETQPARFADGKGGNTRTITLSDGETDRSIQFAEFGLSPRQVTIESFLASTDHNKILQNIANGSTATSGKSLRLEMTDNMHVPSPQNAGPKLTLAEARQAVRIAAAEWVANTNADTSNLGKVKVRIADLPGDQLAVTDGLMVTFDSSAAGQGWFVDHTPGRDEEFAEKLGQLIATTPAAKDHVDLLTVAAHELGHVLGMEDVYSSNDDHELLAAVLATGIRKKP
jgi:hypothetical protein